MSAGLAGEREDMITDTCSIQKDEGWDDLRLLFMATPWSIPAVMQIPLAIHNLL